MITNMLLVVFFIVVIGAVGVALLFRYEDRRKPLLQEIRVDDRDEPSRRHPGG